jgi:hypothetical protein
MNKLPLASLWRDVSHGRIVRKSAVIALATLIHVPIALAILGRAAAMFA